MGTKNVYNNTTYAQGATAWTIPVTNTTDTTLLTSISASVAKFKFSTGISGSLFVSSSV